MATLLAQLAEAGHAECDGAGWRLTLAAEVDFGDALRCIVLEDVDHSSRDWRWSWRR